MFADQRTRASLLGSALVGAALCVVAACGGVQRIPADSLGPQPMDEALDTVARMVGAAFNDEQPRKDEEPRRIAVVTFQNEDDAETKFGRFLAEELTTRLARNKRFVVIERGKLDRVLAEQRLQLTSKAFDPATVVQVGKLLGADALLIGAYTRLGETVRVNARVVRALDGIVLAAASATIQHDLVVDGLIGAAPRKETTSQTAAKWGGRGSLGAGAAGILTSALVGALLVGSIAASGGGVFGVHALDAQTRIDARHHTIPVELAMAANALVAWMFLGAGLVGLAALALVGSVVAATIGAGLLWVVPRVTEEP